MWFNKKKYLNLTTLPHGEMSEGQRGFSSFRFSGFQGFRFQGFKFQSFRVSSFRVSCFRVSCSNIQTVSKICSSGFSPTGRCPEDRGVFQVIGFQVSLFHISKSVSVLLTSLFRLRLRTSVFQLPTSDSRLPTPVSRTIKKYFFSIIY